jgi:integrase
VNEVLVAFLEHATEHYRDLDGNPTGETKNVIDAIRPLKHLYGLTPAKRFGPLALRVVRDNMIRSGLSRGVINRRVSLIKRVFRWAVSMQLVKGEVYTELQTLQGLEQGRTQAPEAEGVSPVAVADVEAALSHMTPPVAAMAQMQLWTGARVGEMLVMRTADIIQKEKTWEYRPHCHKGTHRRGTRVIYLGPKAQEVLRPFLLPDEPTAYLFSPARWMAQKAATRIAARKTKRQPSQALSTRRKATPKRKPSARYDRRSYRQAVVRACKAAGVAPWSPLQLRHTRATELRALYGIEAARVILGHSKVETTQIYAERDLERASQIMGQVG